MRELHGHKVNPANDTLSIQVTDEPGAGGANHCYVVSGYDSATNPSAPPVEDHGRSVVFFQNGPINEVGVNGMTQEVLLAIVIDRLESFQAGPYACPENERALAAIIEAQAHLKYRTQKRMDRGVEGTHQK